MQGVLTLTNTLSGIQCGWKTFHLCWRPWRGSDWYRTVLQCCWIYGWWDTLRQSHWKGFNRFGEGEHKMRHLHVCRMLVIRQDIGRSCAVSLVIGNDLKAMVLLSNSQISEPLSWNHQKLIKTLPGHCWKGTIMQCAESMQNSIQHHKILHIVE